MTTYLPSPVRRAPRLADQQGLRTGLAHGAHVLATASAAVLGLGQDPALVLLAVTAVVGGLALSSGWAVVLGASCWAFWTGFLDHRYGQLTLGDADLERLGLLVVLAALGSLAGAERARRRVRRG